jgi:signal transduction histidine kinase
MGGRATVPIRSDGKDDQRAAGAPDAHADQLRLEEESVTEGRSGMVAGGGGAAAVIRRRVSLAVLFRDIVSPGTWLAVIHLMVGFPIGMVSFITAIAFCSAAIGSAPAALLGIPLLAVALWLCQQLARAERARFRLLLGQDVPGPPKPEPASLWRRMLRILSSGSAWRSFGYAVLRLPLGLVEFVLVTVVWSAGLALLTVPVYNAALPGGGAHLAGFTLHGPWRLAVAALAGLVVLLAAPWLTRVLATADTSAMVWLIGSRSRADLTARIGELETSRAAVVDAAEAERRRIERDLHDGAQQRLVSLAMELGRAKAKFSSDPEAAAAIVGQAHEQAKEALAELRNLVRGVHPPVLSDRGLDAALSGLAALSPVPVTVAVDIPARPPASIEAIAYFVVAEALTNVAKHAHASRAVVTVRRSGDLLTLVIYDDGVGGADPAGQGLSGLAARVSGVDGRLWVSSPEGGPTSVEVVLPCVS